MSKEYPRHLPEVQTTPERVLEERGQAPEISKEKLTPAEVEARVTELAELSAARPEAMLHLKESWGGFTKAERAELKKKGKEAVASRIDALKLDPELIEFQERVVDEYDEQIQKLASDPQILKGYKQYFEEKKQALADAVQYEHLHGELTAIEKAGQKGRMLFGRVGKAPGPIERRKLLELKEREEDLRKKLEKSELDPAAIDLLRRREVCRVQRDLNRYNFAETESRKELIREMLPDLISGAPVLFQGETGSGKSQLAKYISERYLGKTPTIISVSEQIKESQIIGSRGLEAGQTVFNYSEFVKAQKEGRPVILDEIDLMPHEFSGLLHDLLQKRVGDIWVHPVTGERIPITAPIMATANLKSERYKQRYELDVATLRRFIGGAGAREIHYLDIGKKDKEGRLIAPETMSILRAVLADRNGDIDWDEEEAREKVGELNRFVSACRKIQEDFTVSLQGEEESLARSENLAFKKLVITLKDQIEIMKAWKAGGFEEPLERVILREFFHKAEISGRAAKDRENMARVFIANKFFSDTKPEEFKIQGLSSKTLRAWQGKE